MSFANEIIPELTSMLNKAIFVMHGDALDFAPRGWSNELRSSIYAIKARKKGKKLIASLVSKAEYSDIVHDSIRRHASPQSGPAFLSYTDFGSSGDAKTSYGQGYRLRKGSSDKYATLFLDRAIEENQGLIK